MQFKMKATALAVALALGPVPTALASCPTDGSTPFAAGPADPVNGFATYVQDSQGMALELCVNGDGNGICFFDPALPNNQFSQLIGFGPEAFWWLAEGNVATARVDALVVMAAEDPAPGEQFPFTRLRIRIVVADPGVYTLTRPYGQQTWVLTTADTNAVNESFDIQFAPDAMNQGWVGPWLQSVLDPNNPNDPPLPVGFIGDGTPRLAAGIPCGTNFFKVEAINPDGGVTPAPVIDPNDGDGLTVTAVGNAVNGLASLNGGDVVFTPATNFSGQASFLHGV